MTATATTAEDVVLRPAAYGRCTECGYVMLPLLALSPCGHDAPVEEVQLEERGTIYSWTASPSPEGGLATVAMADFLDGRLRVVGPIVGTDAVAIGDSVRALVREPDGLVVLSE